MLKHRETQIIQNVAVDQEKILNFKSMLSYSEKLSHMKRNVVNNTSRTDWARIDAMSDNDIDTSDIPPLTDEFFERATLRIPANQAQNLVQLDPDVKQWFQAQGEQYKTIINNVLRQYIESQNTQHQAERTLAR